MTISDGSCPTGRSFLVFPLLGLAVLVVTVEKNLALLPCESAADHRSSPGAEVVAVVVDGVFHYSNAWLWKSCNLRRLHFQRAIELLRWHGLV